MTRFASDSVKRNALKPAAVQAAARHSSGMAIADNRNAGSILQLKAMGVIQAVWKDKDGKLHYEPLPEGWVEMNNNVIGHHWVPGNIDSEDDLISSSEEEIEEKKSVKKRKKKESEETSGYEPDSDEERHNQNDPEELFREKNDSYRKNRKFFSDKKRDTRKNLIKRQTDEKGNLRSGFKGDGEIIELDKFGREIREHKNKNSKHKQPDIDHIRDWIKLDTAIDKYRHEESSMSEAELETFKDEVYNHEDNLEILSKKEHKKKEKTTKDQLKESDIKNVWPYIQERRKEYKSNKDAQERRDQKRERIKKKNERKLEKEKETIVKKVKKEDEKEEKKDEEN
ncbi:MAG: hypothetical protein NTW29_16870 [Bacteroidetes bacterium]|nr:hypothetical protein [Bacteroidota bacterium]